MTAIIQYPYPLGVSALSPLAARDLAQAANLHTTLIDPRNGAGIVTSGNPSAWGDGSHDDTTAINAATAYARSKQDITNSLWPYSMEFRGGEFLVSNVDMTLFRSRRGMTCWGGNFIGQGSADPIIDMTGSSFCTWYGLNVRGNADAIGIQIGRANISATQPTAQSNKFFAPQTTGTFSKAAMFNYASENSGLFGAALNNSDASGNAAVYIIDGYGTYLPTSAFATIATVGSAYSCMKHRIDGILQNLVSGPALKINRAFAIRYEGYASAEGQAGIIINYPDTFIPGNLYFDVHTEPSVSAVTNTIYFTMGGSARTVADLTVIENGSRVGPFLGRDGTSQMTVNGALIKNSRINDGTGAFVDDETKFLVRAARFSAPTTALLPTTASFVSGSSGWTVAMDRNPAEVSFTVA